MPTNCCVPLCTANIKKCKGLSFHRFPNDQNLRKLWITKIRRDVGKNFQIKAHTTVCSRHFTPDSFLNDCGKQRFRNKLLNKGAIPMLFDWNSYQLPEARKDPAKKYVSPSSIILEETPDNIETVEDDAGINVLDFSSQTTDTDGIENERIKALLSENERLKRRLFNIENISVNDDLVNSFTGFSTYAVLKTFFDHIEESAQSMNYAYSKSQKSRLTDKSSLLEDFFMYLVKLKKGYTDLDLSLRFDVKPSTVSRKIISWANFLFVTLGRMTFWLSRNEINSFMPKIFKEYCPTVRVIVDCTEIKVQNPSSLLRSSQLFSSYKNCTTVKCLIGITPHGTISFISKLYSGCCSDVEIFRKCGITTLLEPGDSVMADKGFMVSKDLEKIGCSLVIPTFMNVSGQFDLKEIKYNRMVTKLRIHIERAIGRIKTYDMFAKTIPLNMMGTLQQHWTNAVLLTNFKPPLVKKFITEVE